MLTKSDKLQTKIGRINLVNFVQLKYKIYKEEFKMENKKILVIVLVVVLIALGGFGVYKYTERKNAEKALNDFFDLQEQIVNEGKQNTENIFTQGIESTETLVNGMLDIYNNMEEEQEKEAEEDKEQMLESFSNMQQQILQDGTSTQQQMLKMMQ